VLLASNALHKEGRLWDPLVGYVGSGLILLIPQGCETSPQSDWEEGGCRLQLLGLLGYVYRQGGGDPEKVVITDATF